MHLRWDCSNGGRRETLPKPDIVLAISGEGQRGDTSQALRDVEMAKTSESKAEQQKLVRSKE